MKNNGKVALITGSSNGIGAGIAKVLGRNGYSVIVTYFLHKESAEEVVRSIINSGGEAVCTQLDVTSEDSVKSCFQFIKEKFGKLDVLVNNAGIDGLSPVETCTFDKWKSITRVKIDGNFLCTKYALPLLKKCKKADLIVIMSGLGERPDPEDVAYSVGTAATVCFVKAMALSLAKHGIRTNGVGPGETRTSNNSYWKEAGLDTDEAWKEFTKKNPLGRVTTPEDVGETVLATVENKTEYWNGNFIYVNGGGHLL